MLKRHNHTHTRKKRKGQSTIEYIILIAAVIAALLVFLGPEGTFNQAVKNTMQTGTDGMVDMANRLATSRPTSQDN